MHPFERVIYDQKSNPVVSVYDGGTMPNDEEPTAVAVCKICLQAFTDVESYEEHIAEAHPAEPAT